MTNNISPITFIDKLVIAHNPELQREAEVQSKSIYLANGTTITAISGDYAGAAGSNHGLVSYDELWAYTSESSRRLWEELTPVPTRRNSIRFITTYAGFEGESELLMDLYKQVVSKEEHPEGQGERLHPDLPIYETLSQARKVLNALGTPEEVQRIKTELNRTGLGNHPVLIKGLARLARFVNREGF